MTSAYDAWKTTNRSQEAAELGHEAFHRSQEYMDAYVDYCDVFDESRHYDNAFDRWADLRHGEGGDYEASEEPWPDDFAGWPEERYDIEYGEADLIAYDPFGDS